MGEENMAYIYTYIFTSMQNLKNKIKQNGNRRTETEKRRMVARGWGVKGGSD